MNKLALVLALASTCVLETAIGSTPAFALETYEAKIEASDAASQARIVNPEQSKVSGPVPPAT